MVHSTSFSTVFLQRPSTRRASIPKDGSLRVPPILMGMTVRPSFRNSGSTIFSVSDFQPVVVCDTLASMSRLSLKAHSSTPVSPGACSAPCGCAWPRSPRRSGLTASSLSSRYAPRLNLAVHYVTGAFGPAGVRLGVAFLSLLRLRPQRLLKMKRPLQHEQERSG
jgi:hypothetical protein